MKSIGITGIIGSGKSMLSQVFRSMDVPVYDADTQAKQLMGSDLAIRNSLIDIFGEKTYIKGTINKEYMKEIVFGNDENRKIVNSIVHPAVKQHFMLWRQQTDANIVAIESAIIFEAKIDDILDYIIFVDAPEQMLIKRICRRDNVSEETAINKIKIQRINSGRERCDSIFVNDKDHSLIEQAENFIINNIKH